MRKNHVKIFFAHVEGSQFVEAEESVITFARAYTVNGIYVSEDWAELRFTPFGQLWLSPPEESRSPTLRQPYEEFLASLTDEDWLEETAGNVVVIPISSFEFVEGNWFEEAA